MRLLCNRETAPLVKNESDFRVFAAQGYVSLLLSPVPALGYEVSGGCRGTCPGWDSSTAFLTQAYGFATGPSILL